MIMVDLICDPYACQTVWWNWVWIWYEWEYVGVRISREIL